MNAKDSQEKRASLEVISLNLENLNACMKLDAIALNELWSKQQWEKELTDSQRLCQGIYNHSNLIVFGCGWMVLDELHITAIAVHPLHRRLGLGRHILSSLFCKAIQAGCTRSTLEVQSNNKSALGLYLSCGFSKAGLRHNYYKNGDDAIIMWRSLKKERNIL